MKLYPGAVSVLDVQATLGECPVWSARENVLYFADILAPAIHRFDPASGAHSVLPMPEHTGCFGLRAGGGFVAAMRSGVFLLDAAGRVERKVGDNPTDPAQSRFNDGRVDPWGRFWCGTIWQPRDRPAGVLCRLDPDLSFRVVAGDVLVSNGLAFAPGRDRMYHSDTPNHVLYAYPLDPTTGEPGSRAMLKRFPQGQGRPDGAAVDSEGCYWSALFDGGRVVRLSPAGELLAEIPLPVRWPTMVAFGGPDLKTLFITSSRENRSEAELAQYPQSGNLFAVTVDVAGRVEPCFAG
ncbi:6-deoxy-6-sulfogluconolactonase [Rhodovastum atsumiense]|uniref:SMP-30/gluconolactonase/LRE family protein n=1 Tax=Rhodovastum atsumiense TaxID=504468 RepID=A0A5M6ILG0_9PROT|nr:SMP-30/gluconolactonase/LRE family protein [Rhodovastum atsumiense]KAA5609084.1 SMP-30/gluconolactonase/LRE family protein [Rhodovastum atsumiense]CAH2602162.1 6-deoxy-6-sulfogluconolactonase [Rhodovastum atsumiense]